MKKASISVSRVKGGKYTIAIYLSKAAPKRTRGGQLYEIVDIHETLPLDMTFDGIRSKPTIVLKIFRKFTREEALKLDRRRMGRKIVVPQIAEIL